MDLNFNKFDMRDPDGAKAEIRRYLESKGLNVLLTVLALHGVGNEVTLVDEMMDLIYGSWAEGYNAGEQRTIDRYDPDPYDDDD